MADMTEHEKAARETGHAICKYLWGKLPKDVGIFISGADEDIITKFILDLLASTTRAPEPVPGDVSPERIAVAEAQLRLQKYVDDAYGNPSLIHDIDTLLKAILRERAGRCAHTIKLTPPEIQSGLDRVKWAEGLIRQLPETHDGRNSWLLNYGRKE